ncbi:zinc/cadmium resistance protein isoform X2 [Vespula squamosa]|uniref:Zinc/cadmium resistance protein isoform X2 n=1 Tax=Vespula squamosa TaxID=30214 RepID=A0ABD2A709_VESSQ
MKRVRLGAFTVCLCCRVMPVKEWFRKLQPVQLYLVVFFTVAFFIIEMVASHVTHSLTLLLNAYYMLCNIIATLGCLVSIKIHFKGAFKD